MTDSPNSEQEAKLRFSDRWSLWTPRTYFLEKPGTLFPWERTRILNRSGELAEIGAFDSEVATFNNLEDAKIFAQHHGYTVAEPQKRKRGLRVISR